MSKTRILRSVKVRKTNNLSYIDALKILQRVCVKKIFFQPVFLTLNLFVLIGGELFYTIVLVLSYTNLFLKFFQNCIRNISFCGLIFCLNMRRNSEFTNRKYKN